ncbi:DUF2798 domain-containing protein [Burkholderiaceae bacterium FT117]|uniref:DUF2798 domain-containing protein n=1 Tax=Zeimonas sediminis TaxID=2944268 RepID=UPI0023432013|nr:DUF2798 domain-containing protein [Zeimonas sediminis]MCM5569214.1 DUF2798 domain-containing protein [Zeimonas sediminis]
MNARTTPQKTFLGTPRIPARYAGIVMPLLLSLLMTLVVSLISTLRALGPIDGFLGTWLGAWGLSWLVAFPTLLLVLPIVRRLTAALVESG